MEVVPGRALGAAVATVPRRPLEDEQGLLAASGEGAAFIAASGSGGDTTNATGVGASSVGGGGAATALALEAPGITGAAAVAEGGGAPAAETRPAPLGVLTELETSSGPLSTLIEMGRYNAHEQLVEGTVLFPL